MGIIKGRQNSVLEGGLRKEPLLEDLWAKMVFIPHTHTHTHIHTHTTHIQHTHNTHTTHTPGDIWDAQVLAKDQQSKRSMSLTPKLLHVHRDVHSFHWWGWVC